MIKRQILTAVFMTAALLLTGCLMDGGPVVPTGTPQTLPVASDTEESSEDTTYYDLPEVDPLSPEKGEKASGTETAAESTTATTESVPSIPETTEPLPVSSEITETSIESSGESTQESGGSIESSAGIEPSSDLEGSSDPLETTTAPGPHEELSDAEEIALDPAWQYAEESQIHSGTAVLYRAKVGRKNIVVGVNAGHGTRGGESSYTYCHPDHTPKVTGGTTAAGSIKAMAVSSGMEFRDGTPERAVTLKTAQILRDLLLKAGYDVLMLRDGDDVQLDNVARTVICNELADCHIAIHWDGDGRDYDKGAYFLSVPGELKGMYPVSEHWREHEALGSALIEGCRQTGYKIWDDGSMDMDLTQTSYSKVPSVDIEMGNQNSPTDEAACRRAAKALFAGIEIYFAGE